MAKKIPLRQCVGCGEMKGKKDMLRVLKTVENEICLDVTGKKTEEAHIFAGARIVCFRHIKTEDWSAPSK